MPDDLSQNSKSTIGFYEPVNPAYQFFFLECEDHTEDQLQAPQQPSD